MSAVLRKITSDAYMAEFQNILSPGKEPVMTKKYNPKIPYRMKSYLNPDSLKKHVLKSAKIQNFIDIYSKKTKLPKKDVRKQIEDILEEIGLARSLPIIRWCGITITALGKRITSGIYVNEANLKRAKERIGSCPVLYLPSHRSYLDFILMSYICFHYEIEIPGIAAGMDFHAMVGIGTVLRKTGAFFMRRSFSGDDLYWDVFREYINSLVKDYHIGLEFFIEGTRSRNFKALVPKVGLLSMALQPFFMGEVPDVTIIPVSVSYDKVLEEELFVYELLGVPKPKESTKGFFKALKIIEKRFGRMYMDFGEPMSVREYFGNDLDRVRHANVSPHLQKLNKAEIELIKGLANTVVHRQQERIVLTTFNLIAVYFAYGLCVEKKMMLETMSEGVLLLKSMFDFLGAHVATNSNCIKPEILETIEIHSNILRFEGNHLEFTSNEIATNGINRLKMKAHSLDERTIKLAVSSLSLQLYINPCLFWIAEPSCLVLSFLKLIDERNQPITVADLKESVKDLKAIFSNEFIFDAKNLLQNFDRNLKFLEHFGVLAVSNEGQIVYQQNEISEILLNNLAPFLCMYFQLTETLLTQLPESEFSQKDILSCTQKNIETLLLYSNGSSLLVHPYCLAIDNLNIAITTFAQQGYLTKSKSGAFMCHRQKTQILNKTLLQFCRLLPFQHVFKVNGNDFILKSKM